MIEELDLEARFTHKLVDKVLSAIEGHVALRSLALSCIVDRDMNPDLIHRIVRTDLPQLERLLIMVQHYEGFCWPGELVGDHLWCLLSLTSSPFLLHLSCLLTSYIYTY